MVTTVGTSTDIKDLVENFILLERDAIAAYDEVIARLDSPARKERVSQFKSDHERHLDELTRLAARVGANVPQEPDAKSMLTTGEVQLADMAGGDGAILKAMSTNETDTVTAYERGCDNTAVPVEDRAIFARALEDERSHKAWMEAEAKAA
ncbi:DUF2383 domain-containing protein [Tranquillimonas alkanivorans]|uniref:Rubrerythrin n=1 Tax=Tranquillimonas alkanivorans TaxID=441119 RepID=A0A1I5QXI8_9RHOB|nr:ferritin-like domain-containing protein [Tranquillimonas alkanivorans]SFP50807.1 Rubrerythrin [Tranquillimonas alkanivorans]